MATSILETLATVRPDGALELDRKVTGSPGRVKVHVEYVEYVETSPAVTETVVEFVDRTRRELAATGHRFMNDQEVAAWIEELRT